MCISNIKPDFFFFMSFAITSALSFLLFTDRSISRIYLEMDKNSYRMNSKFSIVLINEFSTKKEFPEEKYLQIIISYCV